MGDSGAGLDPRKKERKPTAGDCRWTNTRDPVLVNVVTTRQLKHPVKWKTSLVPSQIRLMVSRFNL